MPSVSLLAGWLFCLALVSADETTTAPSVDAPSMRVPQEQVLANLRLQSALRQARTQIEAKRFAEAIRLLEPLLADADGHDTYLTLLESAYRGRIAACIANHQADEARLLSDRLRVLDPTEEIGSAVPRVNATPATVETNRSSNQPTSGTPTPSSTICADTDDEEADPTSEADAARSPAAGFLETIASLSKNLPQTKTAATEPEAPPAILPTVASTPAAAPAASPAATIGQIVVDREIKPDSSAPTAASTEVKSPIATPDREAPSAVVNTPTSLRKAQPIPVAQAPTPAPKALVNTLTPLVVRGKAPDTSDSAHLVAAADHLFEEKRYGEAVPLYEKAYEQDPVEVRRASNRWGYSLLVASWDRLYQADGQPRSRHKADLDRIRDDVQRARGLIINVPSYETFANDLIAEIDRFQEPTRPAGNDMEMTAPAAATPAKAPRRGALSAGADFRHLARDPSGWSVLQTPNFIVYHLGDATTAERMGRLAEEYRVASHELWFSGETLEAWQPRCELYLYRTAAEFASATGAPGETPGLTELHPNGASLRRVIKLRLDFPQMDTTVFPHEMTHAVIGGRVGGLTAPKWADEGMAVLTEPRDKQDDHVRNLVRVAARGLPFSCRDMMHMNQYPTQRLEFYAQSVGLTRFLMEKGGPAKLVAFIRATNASGRYEEALASIYGYQRFSELEQDFRGYVESMQYGGQRRRPELASRR